MTAKQIEKFDKKFVKRTIAELKRYGFSYIPNKDKIIEDIKAICPDIKIRKIESMVEVILEER